MSSVNKVTLLGRVGKDPEARSMQNGSEVVSFSVATSDTWTKDGQKQERTEWHNVVIFNEHLCKVAKQYLRKGSQVYLEGSLQTRKWTDKDGADRYTTEVVLQRFRGELVLLGGKADSDGWQNPGGNERSAGNAANSRQGSRQAGSQSYAQPAGSSWDEHDDSPPF